MAQDQIRQMVNFILQEAHEKANEIRVKTEHDFNLEKQTLVHEAKLSVQEEFAKKEKDREIQERIARSSELGECRVRKMRVRDELLSTLLTEAGNKCGMVARGQNYPHLIQKLIVQALIKIEENDATVYCRAEDVDIVSQILPDAVAEYVEIMERETGSHARSTYAAHGTGEIGSFNRGAPKAGNAPTYSVMGEDVRHARSTYAAHGTGEIGSTSRGAPSAGNSPTQSVMGEDVRHARSTYAAHGTGEIGGTNRAPPRASNAPTFSVMGEDVRHARSTYAAHGTGEIGSTNRVPFVPSPP